MCTPTKAFYFCIVLLLVAGNALAQSEHVQRTIVVNGHSGEATIYRIDGKSFIDLETLAQISHGTIAFQGNQIVLTLPSPEGAQNVQATEAKGNASGMSTEFMRSGVEFVSAIKAWTNALAYAVQKGIPGDGSRIVILRDRAAEALHMARVSATTESDNHSYQLLSTHFDDVHKWSDLLIGERKSMETGKYSMSADALANDRTYQRITGCTTFLSSMIPSGHYQDNANCR
jgi:uncharacterized protein (DUF2147 family)